LAQVLSDAKVILRYIYTLHGTLAWL